MRSKTSWSPNLGKGGIPPATPVRIVVVRSPSVTSLEKLHY